MEKVRIGNDMRINFSVYRNGEPESFDGASNIVTKLVNEAYNKLITHTYTIAGNIVQFDIDALQLTQCGKCRLFISYTKGGDYTVDSQAFELVNYTDQTGGTEIIGVEIVSINISGDIGINRDGLSAYEVWESYPGNEGKTIEQYFEWLRENPTKTDTSRKIIAGLGLTGGGDFTTDRTIDIGATDDSVVVGADGIKVDTQDSLTSTSITKPLSAAKGKALQDAKADKDITIEAGNGLTGGGDLSGNRTLNIESATDGITPNADNIQLNTINALDSTSATKPLSANQGKVLNDKVVQVKTDLNLDEYTIAEALNLLYSKIIALEKLIADGVLGNVQVDSITTIGDIKYKGASIILLGTAAPSIAPDFEGQTFINTTSPGTVYTAKGVASVSDWKQTSN